MICSIGARDRRTPLAPDVAITVSFEVPLLDGSALADPASTGKLTGWGTLHSAR
jgi:hypothetical protein